MNQDLDKYRGALLGLAVGDALGTTLEFQSLGSFHPIDDIIGGGPFDLAPGQWTDDTSMALCLADSLMACRGFDPIDQLTRYVRWYRKGYWSSTGTCFDIGTATAHALARFERTGDRFCGSEDPYSAGNGSIMRLAPVPMFFAGNPSEAIHQSGESSRTTHGTIACVDACRYMGGLLVGALQGAKKKNLLSSRYSPATGQWPPGELSPEIEEVAAGSFKEREPPAIQGTGYVVRSLEATLWAFHKSTTFREGALLAVNLGDDADTTGAVYGQIASAYYGASSIPPKWLNTLHRRQDIEEIANRLADQNLDRS